MEAATAAPVAATGSIFDPAGGRPANKPGDDGFPKGPDRSSPSTITLIVRSKEGFFNGHLVPAAQAAGFTWTGIAANHLGILSRDEGLPIAVIELDRSAQALGQLASVEILFDPEGCAIEFDAGDRVIDACAKFAACYDGTLCDGLANPLTPEACEALKQHVATVMRRRIEDGRPALIEMPDGTLLEPDHLSYQYRILRKKRGGGLSFEGRIDFDAPKLGYFEGQAAGARMAAELIGFIRAHRVLQPRLKDTIAAALGAEPLRGNYHGMSESNVALGFMNVLCDLVRFGARSMSGGAWLLRRIEYFEEQAAGQAAEKRAFVDRMRAAKAAKKAEREGGAA